jgi:hypothetical protein
VSLHRDGRHNARRSLALLRVVAANAGALRALRALLVRGAP